MLEARLETVRTEAGGLASVYTLTDAQLALHKERIRAAVEARLSRPTEASLAEDRLTTVIRKRIEAVRQEVAALEAACAELEALCTEAEGKTQEAEDRLVAEIASQSLGIESGCAEFGQRLDEIHGELDIEPVRAQVDALIDALRGRRRG